MKNFRTEKEILTDLNVVYAELIENTELRISLEDENLEIKEELGTFKNDPANDFAIYDSIYRNLSHIKYVNKQINKLKRKFTKLNDELALLNDILSC